MEFLEGYEFKFSEGKFALYVHEGRVREFLFPRQDLDSDEGVVGLSFWKDTSSGAYVAPTLATVEMTKEEFFEILQIAYKVWLNENPE